MKAGFISRLAAVSVAAAIAVSLVSCGRSYDYVADSEVLSALGTYTDSYGGDYTGDFRLNMTFDSGVATLMFAHGSYKVTDFAGNPSVSATMTQTVLGKASAVTLEYADGKSKTVSVSSVDGENAENTAEEELTPEKFFGRLTYIRPFVPDARFVTGIDDASTGVGKGYKVYLTNAGAYELLFPMLGDSIYSLAMIYEPQKAKTAVRNASVLYVPTEKGLSLTVSFDLIMYDTPPYVPNGEKADPDDYKLTVAVSYAVTYTK